MRSFETLLLWCTVGLLTLAHASHDSCPDLSNPSALPASDTCEIEPHCIPHCTTNDPIAPLGDTSCPSCHPVCNWMNEELCKASMPVLPLCGSDAHPEAEPQRTGFCCVTCRKELDACPDLSHPDALPSSDTCEIPLRCLPRCTTDAPIPELGSTSCPSCRPNCTMENKEQCSLSMGSLPECGSQEHPDDTPSKTGNCCVTCRHPPRNFTTCTWDQLESCSVTYETLPVCQNFEESMQINATTCCRVCQHPPFTGESCSAADIEACWQSIPLCEPLEVPVRDGDHCCPSCKLPQATCSIQNVLECVMSSPVCNSDQTPEIIADACCPSCRLPPPECDPACPITDLCVRTEYGRPVCRRAQLLRLYVASNTSIPVSCDEAMSVVQEVVRRFCDAHAFRCLEFSDILSGMREAACAAVEGSEAVGLLLDVALPVPQFSFDFDFDFDYSDVKHLLSRAVNDSDASAGRYIIHSVYTRPQCLLAPEDVPPCAPGEHPFLLPLTNCYSCREESGRSDAPNCTVELMEQCDAPVRNCSLGEWPQRNATSCCLTCQPVRWWELCTEEQRLQCKEDFSSLPDCDVGAAPQFNFTSCCYDCRLQWHTGGSDDNCTRETFEYCLKNTPVCEAGEEPVHDDGACCPSCKRPFSLCTREQTIACLEDSPECMDGEEPSFVHGECCPSCRLPKPLCEPACQEETEICVLADAHNSSSGICVRPRRLRFFFQRRPSELSCRRAFLLLEDAFDRYCEQNTVYSVCQVIKRLLRSADAVPCILHDYNFYLSLDVPPASELTSEEWEHLREHVARALRWLNEHTDHGHDLVTLVNLARLPGCQEDIASLPECAEDEEPVWDRRTHCYTCRAPSGRQGCTWQKLLECWQDVDQLPDCPDGVMPERNTSTCCMSCRPVRYECQDWDEETRRNAYLDLPECEDGFTPTVNRSTCLPECRVREIVRPLPTEGEEGDFCSLSDFRECMRWRSLCEADETPVQVEGECCPSCQPQEHQCTLLDVASCVASMRNCSDGEVPVRLPGDCCPSCRPPPPLCPNECEDHERCFVNSISGEAQCKAVYSRWFVGFRTNFTADLTQNCSELRAVFHTIMRRFCFNNDRVHRCRRWLHRILDAEVLSCEDVDGGSLLSLQIPAADVEGGAHSKRHEEPGEDTAASAATAHTTLTHSAESLGSEDSLELFCLDATQDPYATQGSELDMETDTEPDPTLNTSCVDRRLARHSASNNTGWHCMTPHLAWCTDSCGCQGSPGDGYHCCADHDHHVCVEDTCVPECPPSPSPTPSPPDLPSCVTLNETRTHDSLNTGWPCLTFNGHKAWCTMSCGCMGHPGSSSVCCHSFDAPHRCYDDHCVPLCPPPTPEPTPQPTSDPCDPNPCPADATCVPDFKECVTTPCLQYLCETPQPTPEPTETPEPTPEPTETPEPTAEPTETPEPTAEPTETPEPTAEPTETPEPTAEPTETPQPTPEPTTNPCDPNPCPADATCVPDPKECVTTPCLQYLCETPQPTPEPTLSCVARAVAHSKESENDGWSCFSHGLAWCTASCGCQGRPGGSTLCCGDSSDVCIDNHCVPACPDNSTPEPTPERRTVWFEGPWSPCLRSCTRRRIVYCSTAAGVPLPDDECGDVGPKPDTVSPCEEEDDDHCQPEWVVSPFSSTCSASCTQSRTVFCVSQGEVVPSDQCDADTKPRESRSCSGDDCELEWHGGNWSTCNDTCHRSRDVFCLNTTSGEEVDEDLCTAFKPRDTRTCWGDGCGSSLPTFHATRVVVVLARAFPTSEEELEELRNAFVEALAASLGIDQSRIILLAVTHGSVTVDFLVEPTNSPDEPTPEEAVEEFSRQLQDPSSPLNQQDVLQGAFPEPQMSVTQVDVRLCSNGRWQQNCDGNQPEAIEEETRPVPVGLVLLLLAAVVVVGVLGYVAVRKYRRRGENAREGDGRGEPIRMTASASASSFGSSQGKQPAFADDLDEDGEEEAAIQVRTLYTRSSSMSAFNAPHDSGDSTEFGEATTSMGEDDMAITGGEAL